MIMNVSSMTVLFRLCSSFRESLKHLQLSIVPWINLTKPELVN